MTNPSMVNIISNVILFSDIYSNKLEFERELLYKNLNKRKIKNAITINNNINIIAIASYI